MDLIKLSSLNHGVQVKDSKVLDASYEDIGKNFARKFFKEKGTDEGFEEAISKWRYRNKEESVEAAKEEIKLLKSKPKSSDKKKSKESDVKEELYKLTQQFVRKYWRQYYPRYKGDIDDLISDFYIEFLTPKSRVAGKEESLLDKFNDDITTLPYLVKVAVQRKLIDRARTDKGEKNYTEKYDEETGEFSLDYIAEHVDDPDIQLEDIEFTEDEILELRDRYDDMPEDQKKAFLKYYNEVKNVLSPNFKKLFKDIVEGETE